MGKSLTLYEYKDKLIRDNKGKEEILLIKEVIVVEGKGRGTKYIIKQ